MLHVASDAGVMGEEDIGIYSVSKAALIMLSNMLAIEGGRRGVRSNASVSRAISRRACATWARPAGTAPRTIRRPGSCRRSAGWVRRLRRRRRGGVPVLGPRALRERCCAARRRRDARRDAHRARPRTVDSIPDGHDRPHLRSAPRFALLRPEPHEPGDRGAERAGARRGRGVRRSHDRGVPPGVQGLARLRGADRGAAADRAGQPRLAQRRLRPLRGPDRAADVEPRRRRGADRRRRLERARSQRGQDRPRALSVDQAGVPGRLDAQHLRPAPPPAPDPRAPAASARP